MRPPDLYIAAMGRSGSTSIANRLTEPPARRVLVEPSAHAFGMGEFDLRGDAGHRRSYLQACTRMLGEGERPDQWGVKEVRPETHAGAIDLLAPAKVLILVRDIRDVFLSLVEKHRRQNVEGQYPSSWSAEYCMAAAESLVALRRSPIGRDAILVRYEDHFDDPGLEARLGEALGWPFGGDAYANFDVYDRMYEVDRNRSRASLRLAPSDRGSSSEDETQAVALGEACREYQSLFEYGRSSAATGHPFDSSGEGREVREASS